MNDPRVLARLFVDLMERYGLGEAYLEARIRVSWPQLLGHVVNEQTSRLSLRKRVLYVSLSSSVLRWELSAQKDDLLGRCNALLGGEFLREIVFR